MLSTNEKITMRQLQILIVLSAMGTGVIVLPRRVAEFAGQDGWAIVALLVVVAMVLGALISAAVTAAARATKPNAGFIETTGMLLSRPVAYILGGILWFKLVFSAGLELRVFLGITNEVLLPQTPILVVSAVMVALCAYAAAKGIETRARTAEILLYLMVVPFLFLFIVALFDVDFSNLQPVLVASPNTLMNGTLRLGFIFTGLETLLLMAPFLVKGKSMGRAVVSGLGFAGLIILAITVITIASFGRGVVHQAYPVLVMMDMLNLPGAFIERQEALMFSFWIITTFALVNGLLFFGGVLVRDMFFKMKGKSASHDETTIHDINYANDTPFHAPRVDANLGKGVFITAVVAFGVTAIPLEGAEIYRILDFMAITLGLLFLVVVPLFLLAAAKIENFAQKGSDRGSRKTVKSMSLLLLLAIIAISFTSCWDKVEIENRAFVTAMGIDKADGKEDRVTVTLSVPLIQKEDQQNDDDDKPTHIKSASGQTISEALKKLDSNTNKQLYYGQSKLLVLGESLLEDKDLMHSTMNAIAGNKEIDRRIHVLAAKGDASDILEIKPPGETISGLYVAEIYRDKNKIGGASFALDFDRLDTAMQYRDGAIIPRIERESKKCTTLQLDGAVVIKDYQKEGRLTHDELRGFLWTFSGGGNATVVTVKSVDSEKEPLSASIEKHTVAVRFEPINETLRAVVEVQILAALEESTYNQSNPPSHFTVKNIEACISAQISEEIMATLEKFQNQFALDGYDWLEVLRKKQYPLYQVFLPEWQNTFLEMEVIPHVNVVLKW